jgi:hypothetical protein
VAEDCLLVSHEFEKNKWWWWVLKLGICNVMDSWQNLSELLIRFILECAMNSNSNLKLN